MKISQPEIQLLKRLYTGTITPDDAPSLCRFIERLSEIKERPELTAGEIFEVLNHSARKQLSLTK